MASATTEPHVRRRRAIWAEYEATGDDRAEYIDGEIYYMDMPSRPHQVIARRLANLIESVLPTGFAVIESWGWKPGADEFGPDVMVYPLAEAASDKRFTGTPVLCVEITSSNAYHDYVRKRAKYAAAGLDRYWILNPEGRLNALVRDGDQYRDDVEVELGRPTEVSFGVASIVVDLQALVRTPGA